jgi:hypothetical protein
MRYNFLPMQHTFFFPVALRPNAGHGLLIPEVYRSHTTTHHSRDSSGRVISLSQKFLLDNTQHSQQTNIHTPGTIRTYDLSRRAAADLRLRPRGRWDWLFSSYASHHFLLLHFWNVRPDGGSLLQPKHAALSDY